MGRDDSARHPPARGPLAGRAAFLKVASLDFYRKRPRRLRRGGRPHFFPKKWGKRRAGGLSAFSKRRLRMDFHRRRPRRLRPRPPSTGAHGGGGLYKQGRERPRIAARFVGTSYGSLASPQAAKLVPSTVPPLPTEPASLGFGGGPVIGFVTGAAAPRAARIGITLQALKVAALYQLGPPGPGRVGPRRRPAPPWGGRTHRYAPTNGASGMPRPTGSGG